MVERKTWLMAPGLGPESAIDAIVPHLEQLMDPNEPLEVYSTLSPSEAEIIRVMLESEGINADVGGEMQGGFPGALPEVTVLVHADDAEQARKLIASHQAKHAASDEAD
jgi:hypothetical protein